MKKTGKILILTIILLFIGKSLFADDSIVPENDSIQNYSKSNNKSESFISNPIPLMENLSLPNLSKHLNFSKDEDLFITNPNSSYDANFKYKFDFNFYDRKLQLVPKIRISRKIEEKINPAAGCKTKESANFNLSSGIPGKFHQDQVSKATSAQTNSIFVGMDLSYALNKSIYLDSNLSFYQTAMEINDKNLQTKIEENAYRFEGNAMSVSIGLRKQLSDSFSAGLIYSWKQWLNETEDFGETEKKDENKAFDESQKALNLMLRYDF